MGDGGGRRTAGWAPLGVGEERWREGVAGDYVERRMVLPMAALLGVDKSSRCGQPLLGGGVVWAVMGCGGGGMGDG
ncbi:hypothetical protein Dimus_035511 [Dionaea muscipula]